MSKKSTIKKIWNIVSNLILSLFLIVCVVALLLTVLSKRDIDGAATFFGYQMRVVTSDSMAENELTDVSSYEIGAIPVRSMIFIECVPKDAAEAEAWYADIKVGDVLTFRYFYTSQVTITHRVAAIEKQEGGGYLIELEGDNKNSETGQLIQVIDTSDTNSPNYVIGKVVGQSYPLGYLISLLQEPLGMVLIVIVPCFLVILYEVIKIVSMVSASKRARMRVAEEKKDSELEELRRRLAELENRDADAAEQQDEKPVPEAAKQTDAAEKMATDADAKPKRDEAPCQEAKAPVDEESTVKEAFDKQQTDSTEKLAESDTEKENE